VAGRPRSRSRIADRRDPEPTRAKLGVFEVDAFFPPKDRSALALKLKLAAGGAPSFTAWGQGAVLDLQSMLFTPEAKPRAAIIYLAHLSDEERQFVVTLVLSKLVTWMRGQQGTSDLRVLSYMDEVFGFVPPTAEPPAKKPILTILKQGRAFGDVHRALDAEPRRPRLQGDVQRRDVDGRSTQTENDKARVLEGLRSATGGTDISLLDKAIGGLQKRQFLEVSARDSTPRLFSTRWATSYLRGPLTKDQVALLTKSSATIPAPPRPDTGDAVPTAAPAVDSGISPPSEAPIASEWTAGHWRCSAIGP
jgi:hypothetical protein